MFSDHSKAVVPRIALVVITVLTIACTAEDSATNAETHTVRYATAPDGARISYEAHGAGEPAVVFVHGWSCDRHYWDGQLGPLSEEFHVVAVDLAGHGDSVGQRSAWTIESFGKDVAAVVDDLGLDRVVLVGHSMGGDVIVQAAYHLPGKVDGLVWVDDFRQLGTPQTVEQVDAFVDRFRPNFAEYTYPFVRGLFPPDADEELANRVARDMASAPRDVALQSLHSSFTHGRDITDRMAEIRLPIVAINPDDGTTDVESMQRFGVDVILMPNVGHFLMLEDPVGFNRLLVDAIDRFNR